MQQIGTAGRGMNDGAHPIGSSEMSPSECWDLLAASTVGRVGFRYTDTIKVLPVNYILAGQTVVIRTSPTGVLSTIAADDDVAFEVDYHNATSGAGWSVLMSGTVEVMTQQQIDELRHGKRVVPWAGGDRSLHLRFTAKTIEGRRVLRRR
ncbi:MAG TPA: pyridoxamine 5'-phosphate oxidase family protein [Microlunatus sp.]